jgi:hypothetical protein
MSGVNTPRGRQTPSADTSSDETIKVVVRVRPLNKKEKKQAGGKRSVSVNDHMVDITDCDKQYTFDHVLPETSEQREVFDVVGKPVVDCVLSGFNACILAYGQTVKKRIARVPFETFQRQYENNTNIQYSLRGAAKPLP